MTFSSSAVLVLAIAAVVGVVLGLVFLRRPLLDSFSRSSF